MLISILLDVFYCTTSPTHQANALPLSINYLEIGTKQKNISFNSRCVSSFNSSWHLEKIKDFLFPHSHPYRCSLHSSCTRLFLRWEFCSCSPCVVFQENVGPYHCCWIHDVVQGLNYSYINHPNPWVVVSWHLIDRTVSCIQLFWVCCVSGLFHGTDVIGFR